MCEHGLIGACAECDGAGQVPEAPERSCGSCPTCGSLSPWRCGCNDEDDLERV